MSRSVVILGAGPAGLATAYFLCKDGFTDILLLEAEKFVGGISATMRRDDLLFDFGSHRIHPGCDRMTLDLIRNLIGDDLLTRPRRGAIWLDGRLVEYPLRAGQVALGVGIGRASYILGSFVKQRLLHRSGAEGEGEKTSEELLVNRFGRGMYELFYKPYTTKVFGIPPSEMSPEQARRRVASKSLMDIARKALGSGKKEGEKSSDTFLYPRLGFGQICSAMASAIQSAGAKMVVRALPRKIVVTDGRVQQVQYYHKKRLFTLNPNFVCSTIPLPTLASFSLSASSPVRTAAKMLKTRSLVVLYIVVNQDRVGDKDAYYFASPDMVFNRVSEQKNFSPEMAPEGKTVLCADISCDVTDGVWSASDEKVFQVARESFERFGRVSVENIDYWFTRRVRHAYPVYSLGFEENLRTVLDWTDSIENLITLGRQGLFAHNNFHHSVMMARAAADHILSGRPKDQGWNEARKAFDDFKVID
ncbi:MAG: FAD-dependent oxidoreductase [Candidatus Coatesbacteria bacterium]|nr:FAD-dependent oxidoreductase [Candidatus Coatesbacteria bacterium]